LKKKGDKMVKANQFKEEILNAFSELLGNAKISRKETALEYTDHTNAGTRIQFTIRGSKAFEYTNGNVWQVHIEKDIANKIIGIYFYFGDNQLESDFHIEKEEMD
jgi:hypothetical protein